MMKFIANLTLPERVLFSVYSLFSVWLVFSLLGIFSLVTVAVTLICLIYLLWQAKPQDKKIEKIFLWLWLALPLLLIGWMLLRGFYTGDAYAFWLPWAREIAVTGSMPDWLSHSRIPYTSAGPFLTLALAAVFTLLPISQYSVALLPIIFFTLAVLVMVHWLKEKSLTNGWVWVAVLLVVFNSQTAFWSWNMLTESLLLLGYTLFFYCFERVWALTGSETRAATGQRWAFLLAGFCFAVLVKFSSVALLAVLLVLLFRQRKSIHYSFLPVFAGVALPLLIWLARNYLLYDNPVFPLFGGIFSGDLARLYQLTDPFLYWADRYTTIWSRAQFILSEFVIVYPLAFFALAGIWRSKYRWPHILAVLVALAAGIFIIFSESSGMRYLWPYVTLLAVYGTLALRDLRSRPLRAALLALAVATVLMVLPVASTSAFISRLEQLLLPLGQAAAQLHNYWWLVAIILLPAIYVLAGRSFVWPYLSVIFLATGLLHTRWIENKSFLNTWTFIIAVLILLFGVWLLPRIKTKIWIWIGAVFIFLLYFVNSYAQAGVYYLRHEFAWPQEHILEPSRALADLLDQQQVPRSEPIITLDGIMYFEWFDRRPVLQFNSFRFVSQTGIMYAESASPRDLYDSLRAQNFTYVVQETSAHNDSLSISLEQKLNTAPELFSKVCSSEIKDVCLWKINE